jgi:nitrate reductase gamma subunit
VFATAVVLLLAAQAQAGWRFDADRFLQSAHGDMTCYDCHSDVTMGNHPDASRLNKPLSAFFEAEECYMCHYEIEDQLAQGEHAWFKVTNARRFDNCVDCHNPHTTGAEDLGPEELKMTEATLDEDSAECMRCHQEPTQENPNGSAMCLYCHGDTASGKAPGLLMSLKDYPKTPHANQDCTICHLDSAAYPHDEQTLSDCASCHEPHVESDTHDAHIGVSCESCHLSGVEPTGSVDEGVGYKIVPTPDGLIDVHQMKLEDEEGCERCHYAGNDVGAAAMVLPQKSIACLACHSATPTVGDTPSAAGLLVLVVGLVMTLGLAVNCAPGEGGSRISMMLGACGRAATSRSKMGAMGDVLFWDMLFQRRLFKRSPLRWFIHALIFYPFLFRFVWGLVAMVGTYVAPDSTLIWYMVNKNAPGTALLFDVTGLMLLVGVVLALIRGVNWDETALAGQPRQDRLALGLIFGVTLIGFVLEGMRIVMTGYPEGTFWAPVGRIFAAFFGGIGSVDVMYGYVWYIHAILWAGFLAYLPFSRLMHIIMAPIVMAMNAGNKHGHDH